MKILQVINALGAGGAEKLVVELSQKLRLKGHQLDVLVVNEKDDKCRNYLSAYSINIYSLNISNFYNPICILKIIKYLKMYDIIHVHLFPMQYWVAFASLFSRKTCLVTTEHCTTNSRRDISVLKSFDQIVYKQYKKIICVSEKTKESISSYLKNKSNQFITINNGIDIDRINKAVMYTNSELINVAVPVKVIMMVALFRKQKDQDTLIKAIAKLDSNIHLVLVGDGERRDILKQLAIDSGAANRIHFLGLRNDVPSVIKCADIVVLSSHWEGFGLAVVEGMAAGKPVIASDVPGLAEVVEGAGLLFEEGNVDELKNSISKLLNDEDYYKEISQKCIERAILYTINDMVDSYEKVYYSVIKNRNY